MSKKNLRQMPLTDEERYGTIAPIPRSSYLGAASDAAAGLRAFANKASVPAAVPLVGGMKVGDMLVGEAPEELDRWAHGFSPMVDKNVPGYSGLRGVPEVQASRVGPVADTLFLGADATGAGVGLRALGKAGTRRAVQSFNNAIDDTGRDASRRQFIKNAGIAGAGAAAAVAAPKALKAVAKAVAPDPTTAATRTAKAAMNPVADYYKAIRATKYNLPSVHDRLWKVLDNSPEYRKLQEESSALFDADAEAWVKENPGSTLDDFHDAVGDNYYNDAMFKMEGMENTVREEVAAQHRLELEEKLAEIRAAYPDIADLPDELPIKTVTTLKGPRQKIDPEFLKRTGMLEDDTAIYNHLKAGKEYTDPLTGNRARLVEGVEPHPAGHVGTRHDIEWISPKGTVAPHQHWLPQYVPDEEVGMLNPDGSLIKQVSIQ